MNTVVSLAKSTATPAQRRPWWLGTAGLLVLLSGILSLPGAVLTLRWPNNELGNYLFFGPQFVFPFELVWSNQAHVFEGSAGFIVDILVWSSIAVGFGFLSTRLRAPWAALAGVLVVIGFTVAFHLAFPLLGWSFQIDRP